MTSSGEQCQPTGRGQAALALLYQAAFLVVVFVVNPRRAGGRSGWVPPRNGPRLERASSTLLTAGFSVQVVAQVVALGRRRPPGDRALSRCWAGGVLGVAAMAVAVAGQQAMGNAWSTSVSTTSVTPLVTHGAFAATRNPVYAAILGACTAAALIAPTTVSLPALGLVVAGLQLQVRAVEEPMLARVHGDRYREYRERTGRFLPLPGITRAVRRPGHTGARSIAPLTFLPAP